MKQQKKQFNCLLSNDQNASLHHEKLQKVLQIWTKVKDINEAREAAAVKPQEEGPDISAEAISAMQDVADLNTADSIMTLQDRESGV